MDMENMTYEEAIKKLENIVSMLESNNVSLEESVNLFQEGILLSQYCDNKLKNIQEKVTKIFENGQLKDLNEGE